MVLAVNINAPADTQITELIDWMKWFLIGLGVTITILVIIAIYCVCRCRRKRQEAMA